MQYVGPPTHYEPPERRLGGPLLSESLLQSLLTSCTLNNNMRPANANIFRPQYMRTLLPVSSLGAQWGIALRTLSLAHCPHSFGSSAASVRGDLLGSGSTVAGEDPTAASATTSTTAINCTLNAYDVSADRAAGNRCRDIVPFI